jgi:hypothetical protein
MKKITPYALRFYTQVRRRLRLRFAKTALDETLVDSYYAAISHLSFVPDILVPTCSPFETVAAAMRYKMSHERVVLRPFLFDQFAEGRNYSSERLRRSKEGQNLSLERKMFELSDRVLEVTWEKHVAKSFPEYLPKLRHVEHPLLVKPASQPSAMSTNRGMLLYAGAISRNQRNPCYTINLIREVLDGNTSLKAAEFYVPNSLAAHQWFDNEASKSLRLHEGVSADRLIDLYNEADWFLSIGNCNKTEQIASKIYEYMATGKPIIHICSRRDDPNVQELSRYPLALCLYEDVSLDENAEILKAFLDETQHEAIPFDQVALLFPDELPEVAAEAVLSGLK